MTETKEPEKSGIGEYLKRFSNKDFKQGFYDGIRLGIACGFLSALVLLY